MARTALTVNNITKTEAGSAFPTSVAADVSNGNSMVNNGQTIVLVSNADGAAPHNFTVNFGGRAVDGHYPAAITTAISASASNRVFGPWPSSDYGDPITFNADSTQIKFIPLSIG